MTNYQKMAEEFLKKVGAEIKIEFYDCDTFFPDDTEERNIYNVTIKRKINGRIKEFSFKFGDSMSNTRIGAKPTKYDILACLTKDDVEDIDDFCDEFGYMSSGLKISQIIKIYQDVKKEWWNVLDLFGDVLDELQEIQ